MKAKILLVLVLFAGFVGMQSALALHGPETIVIDTAQKAMPPVTFQHHLHQDRTGGDCIVCHHKGKADDPAQQACSDCHGKVAEAPSFKDAMHKQCQGCHKKEAAAGKKTPVMCPQCHVKP